MIKETDSNAIPSGTLNVSPYPQGEQHEKRSWMEAKGSQIFSKPTKTVHG
jgi:hypothetical protein